MSFRIGDRSIGPGDAPFIILEAGINHNGDLALAKEMIRVAKRAGADAVKFQTFRAEEFVGDPELTFTYRSQGKEVTESMLEMFRRYEFGNEEWLEITRTCREEGILFLSTPQNESDADYLLELGVPALKVGSDDFTNLPLLRSHARSGLPLILSCGMSDLAETYQALEAVGTFNGYETALLVCTSEYPTPAASVNIGRLKTLAGAFPNLVLGFSDHTEGHTAAVMAVALGAKLFEKHFTLDHQLPGPDHWFSETPESAAEWVKSIRTAHQMLGSAQVVPTEAERAMRRLARRSVTALSDIAAGETLTKQNLGLRRPGDGLPPRIIDIAWGRKARRAIAKGEQLQLGDFD